jgi:predicted CopG family antitoxin
MSSKNISVRDDVYRALKNAKGPDESFSDVIDRLLDDGRDGHPLERLEGTLSEDEAAAVRERMDASGSASMGTWTATRDPRLLFPDRRDGRRRSRHREAGRTHR